jgi:hypothetical protein
MTRDEEIESTDGECWIGKQPQSMKDRIHAKEPTFTETFGCTPVAGDPLTPFNPLSEQPK